MSALERWIVANPRTTVIVLAIALIVWAAHFFRYELRGDRGLYLDRWTGAIYAGKTCVNCDER